MSNIVTSDKIRGSKYICPKFYGLITVPAPIKYSYLSGILSYTTNLKQIYLIFRVQHAHKNYILTFINLLNIFYIDISVKYITDDDYSNHRWFQNLLLRSHVTQSSQMLNHYPTILLYIV